MMKKDQCPPGKEEKHTGRNGPRNNSKKRNFTRELDSPCKREIKEESEKDPVIGKNWGGGKQGGGKKCEKLK